MSPELANTCADSLVGALAGAEYDDEPYTDEQRAAAAEGREAFRGGEFSSLDEVWREVIVEDGSKDS